MYARRQVCYSFVFGVWLGLTPPVLSGSDSQSVAAPVDETARQTQVYTNFKTFTTRNGLPRNSIRAIHVLGDQVWVGTADGLARYEGKAWTSWTPKDGLPARVISAIDVDARTREVWLGTWGQGLVRFSAGRFDQFSQMNSGLAGDLVFDVVVDGDRVWTATNAGVCLFDVRRDAWELFFPRRADGPETVITSLTLSGKDLFAGTWRGPVQKFEPTRNAWIPLGNHAPPRGVDDARSPGLLDATVGIAAGGRTLWWATQSSLLRGYGSGKMDDSIRPGPIPAGAFIHCIASAGDAQAWLGSDRGVHVLTDWASDTWLTYLRCDGMPGGMVTLSRGGRTLATRSLETALLDNRIRCIAFGQDEVWIGTVNGLALGTSPKRWDQLSDHGQTCNTDQSPERKRRVGTPMHSAAMAVFGPRTKTIALPGDRARPGSTSTRLDLLAVQLTLDQARKRQAPSAGFSIELAVPSMGYGRYGWGTKEDDLAVLAAKPNVVGCVGYIGPNDSIADAAVLRTEVPFVSIYATPLLREDAAHENPFVFRCYGDGPRRDRLLIDYLFDKRRITRLAVLRTPGDATQRHLDWWASHAHRRGHPLVADLPCTLEMTGPSSLTFRESLRDSSTSFARAKCQGRFSATLDALRQSRPEVVLTWCDMRTSANILRQMREAGMDQLFVGGKEIVDDEFASLVGVDPGAVIAAYPIRRLGASPALSAFAKQYAEQNVRGRVATGPGINAYASFDAADHLIEAIKTAGPNREAVQRVLERMSRSATGELHHERLREPGKTTLAHLEAGHWTFQLIP